MLDNVRPQKNSDAADPYPYCHYGTHVSDYGPFPLDSTTPPLLLLQDVYITWHPSALFILKVVTAIYTETLEQHQYTMQQNLVS
jgi:hypothetical protein